MNERIKATGDAAELADLLSLSAKDVAKLASSGVLARDNARGRYRLKASVKNYCENIRTAATGREGGSVTERRRLLKAQGDLAELRAKIDSGALLQSAEVEAGWSSTLRTVRSFTMAIPSRAAALLPHLSRADVGAIADVVHEKLTIAGTYADDEPEGNEQ